MVDGHRPRAQRAEAATATGGSAARQAPPGAATAAPVDRAMFLRLFTTVMLPMFLAAADQTLLATATPVIAAQLGGMRDTSWLAVGYLLASVTMVPVYGSLGDRFGRARMLRSAAAVFAIGSLACGFAPSLAALIAARVLQGLGGGGLMTLSQALIGELIPPRERPRFQGYFALVFTMASIGGPVIGGLVVRHGDWRWLFWVNAPLCAFAIHRLGRLVAHSPQVAGEAGLRRILAGMDLRGALLFALGMGSTLWWLSSAGHRFAWLSPQSAGWLAAAAAGWLLLLGNERRAARPFLPLDLLRDRTIALASATTILFASAMFAVIFYLPMYLQLGHHVDPARAGLLLLPVTAGMVVGSTTSGRIIAHTGRPTIMPVCGMLLSAASLTALGLVAPRFDVVLGCGLATGLGFGTVMPTMQIVTQTAAGRERLGVAAATVSLSRSLGASIGASAFGAVIFGLLAGNALPEPGTPMPAPEAMGGIVDAFHVAFLGAATVCLLASFVASRLPRIRL